MMMVAKHIKKPQYNGFHTPLMYHHGRRTPEENIPPKDSKHFLPSFALFFAVVVVVDLSAFRVIVETAGNYFPVISLSTLLGFPLGKLYLERSVIEENYYGPGISNAELAKKLGQSNWWWVTEITPLKRLPSIRVLLGFCLSWELLVIVMGLVELPFGVALMSWIAPAVLCSYISFGSGKAYAERLAMDAKYGFY